MARHSFIQMSKLSYVKGRISYITSHARQENPYATYRTADNTFWSNLAKESQQEFKLTETKGIFKGKERKALEIQIQQTEREIADKLDKIPDTLKADGYPDVQVLWQPTARQNLCLAGFHISLKCLSNFIKKPPDSLYLTGGTVVSVISTLI